MNSDGSTYSSSKFSSSVCSSGSASLLISIPYPVSFAASLTFCPCLPIAKESCCSETTILAFFSSSSATAETTFAGLNALTISCAELLSHSMISICSLPSSLTIALTLAPLIPTHAPTGSTFATLAC